MIQEDYQKAMKYAGEQHARQTVPGSNANYLLHLANVTTELWAAYQQQPDFDLGFALQVGALHDVLEDTDATLHELRELFGDRIARAVQALTKVTGLVSKEVRMRDSLDRIKLQDREVALVKLADRITNLQPPPGHWSMEKRHRYLDEAILIGQQLAGTHTMLENRLSDKVRSYREYLC